MFKTSKQTTRARFLRDFVEPSWARMNIGRAAGAPETSTNQVIAGRDAPAAQSPDLGGM
jgi:hypothetical protein